MTRDVCEHFNPVDLPCEKCSVQKSTLREAAQPLQRCPSCEYNKQRAQLWRNEAYKLGGHPLDWEPELIVRPKPLTEEEIERLLSKHEHNYEMIKFARAIERAHGIGEKK